MAGRVIPPVDNSGHHLQFPPPASGARELLAALQRIPGGHLQGCATQLGNNIASLVHPK